MSRTNKLKQVAEVVGNFINRHRVLVAFACMMAVSVEYSMAAADAVGQGTADELNGVWDKVTAIVEGTGGKLAALGIILVSVWNREKIGIPYMGLGIASGILLPSLPGIVNTFTYTI